MTKRYRSKDRRAGVPGKDRAVYQRRTKLVPLQPDVAAPFPTAATVNYALKRFMT